MKKFIYEGLSIAAASVAALRDVLSSIVNGDYIAATATNIACNWPFC